MADTQIKLTANFSQVFTEVKKLSGVFSQVTASASDLNKASRLGLGALESNSKAAARTLQSLIGKIQTLANSKSPLSQAQLGKELLGVERRFGAGSKGTYEFSKGIIEAQVTAIQRELRDITTGANRSLDNLLKSLKSYKIEYTDAEGRQQFQRIGLEAKEAIRTLRDSITAAAKSSIEFIRSGEIEQWGKKEFGSAWSASTNKQDGTESIGTGVISASQELEELIRDANRRITERITNGLRETVNRAVSTGKKVTSNVFSELDSGLGALEQGARDTLRGDELTRRLKEIGTLRKELYTKLNDYDKSLDDAARLDKLKSKVEGLISTLQKEGISGVKVSELKGAFSEQANLGGKLKTLFGELRKNVSDVYRKAADGIVNNAFLKGGYDKSFLQDAKASGASESAISEIRLRLAQALRDYRKRQQDEVKQALEVDRREIEKALHDAGVKADVGIAPSSKLETLINNYKAKGRDVSKYIETLETHRRRALEARITQALQESGKLAAGIEQAFKIEAAKNNISLSDGELPRLFQELGARKQQELQTAIDVFNERYAAALFRIKHDLISGKPVNLVDFEAKWSREATNVNAIFDKQSISRVVAEAAAERNARELQAAVAKEAKEQQSLIDKVRKAISTASFKGDSVSVSTAAPLIGELQSAISNAKNSTVGLSVALGNLKVELLRGIKAEIKQLETEALAAGRSIKASDVATMQGKIGSASSFLQKGEISTLLAELQRSVQTVDAALRDASINQIRDVLRNTSRATQLSTKQVVEQLRSARESFNSLNVSRAERLNMSEYTSGTLRLAEAVKREAKQANADLRKQARSVIDNLSRTAELSAQAISEARKQFVAAGGDAATIARSGISGVSNNLNAKVAELIRVGGEFPKELVRYYNNLYQAAGATGAQLQQLMGTVKALAGTVNTNATQVLQAKVTEEIRRVFNEAGKLNRVISDHIYKGLEQKAFTAGIDFKATFNTEILRQEELRAHAALRQRAEGIIKPYEQMLIELNSMRNAPVGTISGNAAQLQYKARITGDKFIKSVTDGLYKALSEIQLLVSSKVISSAEGDSRSQALVKQADSIIKQATNSVSNALHKQLNAIAAQFKGLHSSGDIKGINSLSRELESLRNRIQNEGLGGSKVAQRADKLISDLNAIEKGVVERIANNDAITRAKAMLRSGSKKLGGDAALQVELREIQKAYGELIRSVKNVDKALARKLGEQAKALQQQAKDNFNATGRAGAAAGGAAAPYGMTAAQYRNTMRILPMQMTDIFVGALTGQKWYYILLQQGGQIKDMFGSIGAAIKETGKYLLGWNDKMTVVQKGVATLRRAFLTLSLGTAALFVGLMKKAADFDAQMRRTSVELKFSGANVTGDEFREYAERISSSLGVARAKAADLFKAMAVDAKIPKEAIGSLVEGIEDISTALGNGWDLDGLKETSKTLGELFGPDGFKKFKELTADYALFTEEQLKTIDALYQQGDSARAAATAIDILKKNVIGAKDEAQTPFQKATEAAKEELLKQLQVVGDGLPWQTFMNNITNTAKLLANLAGVAARTAGAILGLIQMLGNGAVRLWFKGVAAKDSLDISLRQSAVEGLTSDLKELNQEYSELGQRTRNGTLGNAADLKRYQQVGEAIFSKTEAINTQNRILEGLEASREAAKGISDELQTAAVDGAELLHKSITGIAKDAEKAASASAKATSTLIKRPGGSDGDKPGKRGGGSRSRSSNDAQKDLERQQQYVQQLKEEWDLRSKMGKLEGLEYDRASGKLKLEGVYLEQARELARRIDERALAQEKMVLAEQRETQLLEHQIALQKELANAKIETFRYTGSDRTADYMQEIVNRDLELQGKLRKIQKDLANKIRRAVNDGKDEKYIAMLRADAAEQVELEKEIAAQNLAVWKQYYEERERLDKDWQAGYKKGVSQVIDWIYSIRSETASAVENWASGMADALAKFARTGKLSFKDLANSILDDIARIASRQFVSALFGGFQQGWTTVPQAQNGTAGMLKELVGKKAVQNVYVTNRGFSDFTSAASSFGEAADAIKQGFTLGGGTNLGLGSDPWGLSTVADRTVQEIGSAVTPAIKEGASGMFSGLFGKIGSIFSGIGSTISNLFKGFNFSSFGGGGGGFFSSLFSGIGGFFSSIFGSLFAGGGYTGAGGKYTPAGIVHAGEYVINAASTRKLGLDFLNRLNGYASGGYVSAKPSIVSSGFAKDAAPMEVNIYNNGDNQVRTQRNNTGGLDIFIEQAVNAVAGSIVSGGAVASAMQQTYALNRGAGLPRSGY